MKLIFRVALIISLMALLLGCSSTPPQKMYLMPVKYPIAKHRPRTHSGLMVLPGQALPQFRNSQFLYRVNRYRYVTDYYHVFMIQPKEIVTQVTGKYLAKQKIFARVTSNDSLVQDDDYELQPTIVALYADYQNPCKPVAVIEVRYLLLDKQTKGQVVLMNKMFGARVPLPCKTSQALIVAWTQGMQSILGRLSRSLAGIADD